MLVHLVDILAEAKTFLPRGFELGKRMIVQSSLAFITTV
jgi:hypothetical protein